MRDQEAEKRRSEIGSVCSLILGELVAQGSSVRTKKLESHLFRTVEASGD